MSSDHVTTPAGDAPLESRLSTPGELVMAEWAQESYRKSLQTVQESLGSMVALTTSLLAGSTAFFTALPGDKWLKAGGVFLFVTALCAALLGAMPARLEFDVNRLQAERLHHDRERIERQKARFLAASAGAMLAGFAAFFVALIIGLVHQTP